ncbi:MAG: segregation/condensation protein A [Candidatus Poribacteria bacterium]|nr:segregation/condensation protein A [Candidatus Poribacteria bacterium]
MLIETIQNPETQDPDTVSTNSMYAVKLEGFEGPLDLLLHLIEKEEMDIYDIQISQITDPYLEYINLMEQLDLDVASEFLVMAATLLHIKSQSILPHLIPEGEHILGDQAELVRQLLEYKRFKEAAQALDVYAERRTLLYSRSPELHADLDGTREFEIRATLFDLLSAFKNVNDRVAEMDLEEVYETVEEETITVEDKIAFIDRQLENADQLLFEELFPLSSSKTDRIVTFLAILELIRIGKIVTVQTDHFESIYIVKQEQEASDHEIAPPPPVETPPSDERGY